jgi:predicted nucleotidyltransferase
MVKKRAQIKKIISKYQTRLNDLGIEVSQIILYGSYAKGIAKDYSDIDVAVVSPAFKRMDIFQQQEVLSKAHHKFKEPIEPIGLTPEQIKNRKGFVREILATGISMYSK